YNRFLIKCIEPLHYRNRTTHSNEHCFFLKCLFITICCYFYKWMIRIDFICFSRLFLLLYFIFYACYFNFFYMSFYSHFFLFLLFFMYIIYFYFYIIFYVC